MQFWIRAEQRAHEARVAITPDGAAALIKAGHQVTVEDCPSRAIPLADYAAQGCGTAPADSWPTAPAEAVIVGLKELDPNGPDLTHRHLMFGHAYKGQSEGPALLARFKRGGGVLYDLEALVDETGRRVAAFGYWAGYAGAAVGLMAWQAQTAGTLLGPVPVFAGKDALLAHLRALVGEQAVRPSVIIIGAKGRVGSGAADLAAAMGLPATLWDIDETAHGGPFPEILTHGMFVNCILAAPGVPVFVPPESLSVPRELRVIADVSCDPSSRYNPIPIYEAATSFAAPVTRVAPFPMALDVMAVDNLPSMLPVESSADFAAQLLPYLMQMPDPAQAGIWTRAQQVFSDHIDRL